LEQAVGIDIEMIGAYAEYFAQRNPWVQQEESFRLPGAVWTDAQLVAAEDVVGGEYQQGWLAPQDFGRQLFGVLERHGSRVVFLYALRPAAAAAFAEAEVTLLKRLLPYLQRSLRAGQLLRRTQSVRQAALDALDAMPMGVLLLSTGGAVLGANRAAREVMAARDVLTVGRGGLELVEEGRRRRFRDVVAAAPGRAGGNRPSGPIALSLPRPAELRPLSLLIWPVPEASRGGPEEPAAVVFIGDPDRAAEIDEERLRQIYGLTAAEARVAALLAQGHRLEEIADLLGVAYETTRKHLKKVLAKMRTDRQAEVVRVVMTGPGGLAR
jgi:DNA-binding CsgD family transcriptional regulator